MITAREDASSQRLDRGLGARGRLPMPAPSDSPSGPVDNATSVAHAAAEEIIVAQRAQIKVINRHFPYARTIGASWVNDNIGCGRLARSTAPHPARNPRRRQEMRHWGTDHSGRLTGSALIGPRHGVLRFTLRTPRLPCLARTECRSHGPRSGDHHRITSTT